jgi:hypothetical protein
MHLADASPALRSVIVLQAFELIKGNLVRFSSDAQSKNVPTAVLVHGILGSRRNLHSFAHMIVEVSSCLQLYELKGL